MTTRTASATRAFLLFVGGVLTPACSREGRPPLHPAGGAVTFRNAPAAKAEVVLRPAALGPGKGVMPRGEVGADGTFRIGTYAPGDGAPAGDYVVTITWPEVKIDRSGDEVIVDRLAGRFGEPEKSKWKVTIKDGDNRFEPFRLD